MISFKPTFNYLHIKDRTTFIFSKKNPEMITEEFLMESNVSEVNQDVTEV